MSIRENHYAHSAKGGHFKTIEAPGMQHWVAKNEECRLKIWIPTSRNAPSQCKTIQDTPKWNSKY